MNQVITKKNLNQSIDFITDIEFNDADFEKIYEQFKDLLENPEIRDILDGIFGISENKTEKDLKIIMRRLIDKIRIEDLNKLLTKIIKNESLIDFIQDLFLEKLL